jgi:DNA mismatch repair protein MutS2
VDFSSAEEGRKKLRDKMTELAVDLGQASQTRKGLRPIDRPLETGDAVFIKSLGQSGTVVSADKTQARVVFGSMEMKVKLTDLALDAALKSPQSAQSPQRTQPPQQTQSKTNIKAEKSMSVASSINLRGLLVDEALEELAKYLDDAYLANLGKVEIIHGKGTGVLRAAVQKFLKKHPHVVAQRPGVLTEGGMGVTVAELK